MRLMIRIAVLALAAVGVKALYEKLAPRKDEFRDAGTGFVDRAGSAAHEVGAKVQDATQRVVNSAQRGAADVTSTAKAQAAEVKDAAQEALDKSLRSDDDAASPRSAPSYP